MRNLLRNLIMFSVSVALPIISCLHFGQMQGLNPFLVKYRFFEFMRTATKLFNHFNIWAHLQVSQRRCPFLHWKILVGGAISSKHTCAVTNVNIVKRVILLFAERAHSNSSSNIANETTSKKKNN